jgi:hypothetical protein
MKYLRKFATEAEIYGVMRPGVALIGTTGEVKFLPPYSNGVYIQHISGDLYTANEWETMAFANGDANGVAIISDKCKFVIAKEDASSRRQWGGYGKKLEGIGTLLSVSESDYDGLGNTSKIIEQLSGYNDGSVIGAPAAEACSNYEFPNGKKGYLPALSEWQAAYDNKTTINNMMSIIGGATLSAEYYWTSTQYISTDSWFLSWGNGFRYNTSKRADCLVRSFTTL